MANSNRRKAIVFVSLVGVLTFTSALLLALAPAPLRPGTSATLFNAETSSSTDLGVLFQTDRPIKPGRWTSILIHTSATPSGDARTMADPVAGVRDHFVIGNGAGSVDGQIEVASRWMAQSPALPPSGAKSIDGNCITICLVGVDRVSERQNQRLNQLLSTLQSNLQIPPDRVWVTQ